MSSVGANARSNMTWRSSVRILLGRAVFDTYPMTDPVAEKILRRNDEREQIAKAEKQFALLALFALPIGCLLARSKSNAGRRG